MNTPPPSQQKQHRIYKTLSTETDNKKDDKLPKFLFKLLITAGILIVCLLSLDVYLIFVLGTDKAGPFGDFFGGVLNPLLTFLTFLCLIITVIMQRDELSLARTEYKRTAEALSTQAVENTFFNIVELHHKIVENLKVDLALIDDSYKKYKAVSTGIGYDQVQVDSSVQGREVFQKIIEYIAHPNRTSATIIKRYISIQDQHNHILGHYFRNLYQALKLIDKYDESILNLSQKKKYASILRAQLSTKELILIFINGLDGVTDTGKFKNLLIKYAMLEHLPIRERRGKPYIKGNETLKITRAMIEQYKIEKPLRINLKKHFGGAFGHNGFITRD